jgi:histone acetyltransferase (RNA polymerase elongator complex component)
MAEVDAEEVRGLMIKNLEFLGKNGYTAQEVRALVEANPLEKIRSMPKKRAVLVAVQGKKIVGVAGLKGNEVKNFFVRLPFHYQGIGKRLLEEIEKIAKEKEREKIWVASSLYATGFYEKAGFKETGKFKKRAEDGTEIRMVRMEKKLKV